MNRDAHSTASPLKGAIWFVLVAGLIFAAVCIYSMANAPRSKIGADALTRIGEQGQEIVNAAFPARIGAAPFRGVILNGVRNHDDGFQASATLFYTNILLDDNCMEIEMRYDATGSFLGARIRNCNDRWASPARLIDLAKR